jgi:hypothetical protein
MEQELPVGSCVGAWASAGSAHEFAHSSERGHSVGTVDRMLAAKQKWLGR